MNKEFSEGFMHDTAYLLEVCMKGKTDTVELDFDIKGNQLNVEITFSVKESEKKNDKTELQGTNSSC